MAGAPLHEPPFDGTLHKLDGAVVLDLEALGDDSDGGPIVRAQRLEDQQELVLLRLDAGARAAASLKVRKRRSS